MSSRKKPRARAAESRWQRKKMDRRSVRDRIKREWLKRQAAGLT